MSDFPNKIPPQDTVNRANATQAGSEPPININLLNIDETIIGYLTDVINPQVTVADTLQPVPVIYATQERWKSIQADGFLREDRSDKIRAPLIALKRASVSRAMPNNPNNKYLYTTVDPGWNQRNVYDRFAVVNGIKPSKRVRQVLIPDYVQLTYDVLLWTEYQEQMNQLIEQINVEADEYWGKRNQYKFRVSINEYTDNSELPAEDIRIIRTGFTMTVDAYLIPDKVMLRYKPVSTNTDTFTSKKVVVMTEVTGSL